MSEKCLADMKIHLPLDLKRDVLDLAERDNRSGSEWVRIRLEEIVYGRKKSVGSEHCTCHGATRNDEGRG